MASFIPWYFRIFNLKTVEQVQDVKFRIFRWVVAFSLGIFLLTGYYFLTAFNVERFERGDPYITLWTYWDHKIPLLAPAIWIYILYYVVIMMPTFLVRNKEELAHMALSYLLITVVGWLCWIYIPVRMEYPELNCTGYSCNWLRGIYDADGGVNVFPSLHVGHSTLAAAIYVTYRHPLRWVMILAALAIAVSTVLTRQHYLVDLPFGALLAIGGWWTTRKLYPLLSAGYTRIIESVRLFVKA
jgi:membrane-associated phospholipid phosphatase